MSDKTTYESLDNRIAPEALTKDHTKGLAVVDGHAVKSQLKHMEISAENPESHISSIRYG